MLHVWSPRLLYPLCYWPLVFVILKVDKYFVHTNIINYYSDLYTAQSILTAEIKTISVSSWLSLILHNEDLFNL